MEEKEEYIPLEELQNPKKEEKKENNGGGFFSKVSNGLKKAWDKTIFPEKIKAAKEEKEWKRQIQAEARQQARQELKGELVEHYKKEELDKMTGKKKKGGFMDKLAKGFEMKGDGGDNKFAKAFSLDGTGVGSKDKISEMLGTGSKSDDNDKINKILGTSKKKEIKTKKRKTKKKTTKKAKKSTNSVEDKIARMLS